MPHPDEKVGVVVIHGVGDNYEGWTDKYLVPQLEKWLAFSSIGELERKDADNDLMLVIETADRYVAVSVGHDEHFSGFCAVTGLEYGNSPKFSSRAARVRNRDELMRYAAMVLSLRSADVWLKSFREAGVPCGIAFNPESEVHYVRDPESARPTDTWQLFVRRWPLKGRDVVMTELFWADMSKVGDTSLSRLLAIIQLVLESPAILGRAFVGDNAPGIHAAIRQLILFANWLMRWVIAGLNAAIFGAAFALLFVEFVLGQLDIEKPAHWLHYTVLGSLILTGLGGFGLFRTWVHKRIGFADVALSTGIISCALLAAVPVLRFFLTKLDAVTTTASYIHVGLIFILAAWFLWTFVIALTVIMISGVTLFRWLRRDRDGLIAMSRAGASVTLTVILGMLWKFALALAGVVTIVLAVPGSLDIARACPPEHVMIYDEFIRKSWAAPNATIPEVCSLTYYNVFLIGIAIINIVSIALVLLAVALVHWLRWSKVMIYRKSAAQGRLRLPRLIASPLIVITTFVSAIINPILIFNPFSISNEAFDKLRQLLFDASNQLLTSVTGLIVLIVLYFVLTRIVDLSDGFVHIGRDLVDHQYFTLPNTLKARIARDEKPQVAQEDAGRNRLYRRRVRVQRRLEALIDQVIARQEVDRLIFVAHSQGSVILRDYLANQDRLVRHDHLTTDALFDVKRIDLVTLGSPLLHIYKYYFHDYSGKLQADPDNLKLVHKVNTWTNMWRVDDPIGQEIDSLPTVDNVGLPPGGHQDYWSEDKVCAKIWQLICEGEDAAEISPRLSLEIL